MNDQLTNILFVGNEPTTVQNLKGGLGDIGGDFIQVASAEEALASLRNDTFQLLICTHRLAGMPATDFLEMVRQESPATVRLFLSGFSKKEEVAGVVGSGAAQHVLLMPWDEGELLAIVLKSLKQSRAQRQKDSDLQAIINNIPSLPTLPTVYKELHVCLANRENYSLTKVTEIVQQDPASTSALLRWANSALFGQMGKIENLKRAIILLGVDVVEGVVLSESMKDALAVNPIEQFEIEGFYKHTVASAVLARQLVQRLDDRGPEAADQAFIVGLLHDMGKLVWAKYFPDKFAEALRIARQDERPLHEVEADILGATHQEIGAYLAAWWSLPQFIVQSVRWHHQPKQSTADKVLAHAIHVADTLVQQFEIGCSGNTCVPEVERDSRVRFELMTPTMMDALQEPLESSLPFT